MNENRKIHLIAADILKEWKNVNFAALPYLSALMTINTINDHFGHDDARSMIRYALSNMSSFRGERAKELKQELKNHLSC